MKTSPGRDPGYTMQAVLKALGGELRDRLPERLEILFDTCE